MYVKACLPVPGYCREEVVQNTHRELALTDGVGEFSDEICRQVPEQCIRSSFRSCIELCCWGLVNGEFWY